MTHPTTPSPRALFSAEEFAAISERSDLKAWWLVFNNYAIVAATFAVMALWPNPLTIIGGVVVLGGRQLGFGVLTHECGHGTLFESKRLNQVVGDWLAAAPTFNNMGAYIRGHLKHHRLAGTADDPDLPNYADYPIDRARLRRKLWRDISGQTGWKQTQGLLKSFARFGSLKPEQRLALARGLVANVLLVAVLAAVGQAWLYAVWWLAFLTTNRLVSRIRQVAEHGAVPDLFDPDARLNTRTVHANPLERLIFCPLGVNYHLEHHMLASVPIYNLPLMHRMLRDKGYYEDVDFPEGYGALLRRVSAPETATA
ncbi:MAG: fatty acid desaturase family protein [Pseudomonadales bacterium]